MLFWIVFLIILLRLLKLHLAPPPPPARDPLSPSSALCQQLWVKSRGEGDCFSITGLSAWAGHKQKRIIMSDQGIVISVLPSSCSFLLMLVFLSYFSVAGYALLNCSSWASISYPCALPLNAFKHVSYVVKTHRHERREKWQEPKGKSRHLFYKKLQTTTINGKQTTNNYNKLQQTTTITWRKKKSRAIQAKQETPIISLVYWGSFVAFCSCLQIVHVCLQICAAVGSFFGKFLQFVVSSPSYAPPRWVRLRRSVPFPPQDRPVPDSDLEFERA